MTCMAWTQKKLLWLETEFWQTLYLEIGMYEFVATSISWNSILINTKSNWKVLISSNPVIFIIINRHGCLTILIDPVDKSADNLSVRISRRIENYFFNNGNVVNFAPNNELSNVIRKEHSIDEDGYLISPWRLINTVDTSIQSGSRVSCFENVL